jgi:ankyrin repeat protein
MIDFSGLTLHPNRFMADPVCAREFLSRGADPNRIGPSGKSILVGAIVSSEDTSWIEVLLEYGARLEQEYLFYALRPRVRQKLQKTSFLLAKGLDPNQINAEWGTPLHYAVECGSPGLVRILLDAGADPTVRSTGKSYHGEPPLAAAEHIRVPKNKEEIIALLQT